MKNIHLEMVRANRTYLGWFDGIGYLYQSGSELFKFNKDGFNKL